MLVHARLLLLARFCVLAAAAAYALLAWGGTEAYDAAEAAADFARAKALDAQAEERYRAFGVAP